MAQQGGSQSHDRSREAPGKVDLVSILYVAGGIPAIIAVLVLLFAIGVPFCGLPA
jgi:hypothetical protein